MALVVTHAKVSTVAPITPPTPIVTPTDWNATHVLSAGAQTLLGNPTAGSTSVGEITLGAGLSFSGATLVAAGSSVTLPVPVAQGGTGGSVASGTLLDNITGFAATGMLVRTGAGTYAFRALTAGSGITIANGDGVAGAPTIALTAAPGALTQRLIAGSSDLPVVATDSILNVNSTAALAITVPASSSRAGAPLTFKDVGGQAGAHTVTLNRTGSDTIDGLTSIALNIPYACFRLVPANDGITTGWSIE